MFEKTSKETMIQLEAMMETKETSTDNIHFVFLSSDNTKYTCCYPFIR